MTIRDSALADAARIVVAAAIGLLLAAGLNGCGQRGPLRLPDTARAASRSEGAGTGAGTGAAATGAATRAPLPAAASASAVDTRDPFAQPPPPSAPDPVPHP